MKPRNIIHTVFAVFAAISGLLLLLAYVLPFLKTDTGETYLMSMSIAAYSVGSSGVYSVSVNFFYSIAIAVLAVLGLFFLVIKNNVLLHYLGIAFTSANAFYAFFLHYVVDKTIENFGTASNISHSGEILFFVYAILGLSLSFFVLLDDLFGERFFQFLDASEKARKESRLLELKGLLEKQLITQKEYDAKKKAVLDEK